MSKRFKQGSISKLLDNNGLFLGFMNGYVSYKMRKDTPGAPSASMVLGMLTYVYANDPSKALYTGDKKKRIKSEQRNNGYFMMSTFVGYGVGLLEEFGETIQNHVM